MKDSQPPINCETLSSDIERSVIEGLRSEIPTEPSVDIPKAEVASGDKITTANNRVETDIAGKLSNLFVDLEKKKAEKQSSLLVSIINLIRTQVRLFSCIIFIISCLAAWSCCKTSDMSLVLHLFEFLKYYIGAVLVELLGLLALIARSVFTSDYAKVLQSVLGSQRKNTTNDDKKKTGP